MSALYRSGRQVDALSVYAEAKQRLDNELGLDPSPELQALETAVLRQDPSPLLSVDTVSVEADTGPATPRATLPRQPPTPCSRRSGARPWSGGTPASRRSRGPGRRLAMAGAL